MYTEPKICWIFFIYWFFYVLFTFGPQEPRKYTYQKLAQPTLHMAKSSKVNVNLFCAYFPCKIFLISWQFTVHNWSTWSVASLASHVPRCENLLFVLSPEAGPAVFRACRDTQAQFGFSDSIEFLHLAEIKLAKLLAAQEAPHRTATFHYTTLMSCLCPNFLKLVKT